MFSFFYDYKSNLDILKIEFFIVDMDRANNIDVPKLLLSYVYVLDIKARLMRALESTTSCKRILIVDIQSTHVPKAFSNENLICMSLFK